MRRKKELVGEFKNGGRELKPLQQLHKYRCYFLPVLPASARSGSYPAKLGSAGAERPLLPRPGEPAQARRLQDRQPAGGRTLEVGIASAGWAANQKRPAA
jgi:hypothetical protein